MEHKSDKNKLFKKVTLDETCNGMCCEFAVIKLRDIHLNDILVVTFSGVYREGSEGRAELGYILGMITLGTEVWNPFKIVIDIRKVTYTWGDDMLKLFNEPEHLQIVMIVSDYNKYAISTLLNRGDPEKDIVDNEFFFNDLDKGIGALHRMRIKKWNPEMQKWI